MPFNLGKRCRTEEMHCNTLHYKHLEQLPDADDDHHVKTSFLTIGESLDACQMKQKGSLVFFKFTKYLQGVSISTTDSTSGITITTVQPHALSVGDTVHISNPTGLPFSGIDESHVVGTHTLSAGSSASNLVITLTGVSADQTAIYSTFTCDIRVDIYKYMDMANGDSNFTRTTTEPVESYTNIAAA